MSKIQIKKTRVNKIIYNKLSYPECINERVYKDIETGEYDFLLPISSEKKGKDIKLIVDVSKMLSILQFFNGCITKKMFLNVTHQIIKIIKECEQSHININNLDLKMDRIFYLPQENKVKCIYWPIVNNQCEEPPYKFLKDFSYKVKFNANEDTGFLAEYKAFFCDGSPFSINKFDKLINKLLGNKIHDETTISKQEEYFDNELRKVLDKNNIEYDPFKYDKDIFVPILIRKKNSEYVQIGNSNFSIGSGQSCDFVINNNYVSKIHATICSFGGRFFIIDQNSTNRTYVGGVQLIAGEKQEIFDNTEIRIANEEFVFKFV